MSAATPSPAAVPALARSVLTLAAARLAKPQQGGVPSPCVGVCHMNAASGLCNGCFRTLHEVAGWGSASDTAKLGVWALVEQRQQGLA